MGDCVFCKMAQGELKVEKIFENENFFSIMDNSPEVEGHALVISKKHFENFLDLPNTLGPELMDCAKKTLFILKERHSWEGFNLINNAFEAGGQVVNHFHLHLMPRRKGDYFRCWDLRKRLKDFSWERVMEGE